MGIETLAKEPIGMTTSGDCKAELKMIEERISYIRYAIERLADLQHPIDFSVAMELAKLHTELLALDRKFTNIVANAENRRLHILRVSGGEG